MKAVTYDKVIITQVPSFYKVKLFEEVARQRKILVIYLSSGAVGREPDFSLNSEQFDSKILHLGILEDRVRLQNILRLVRFLRGVQFSVLTLSGWDCIEFWFGALFFASIRKEVIVESTIYESAIGGTKGLLKRLFLSRMDRAIVSGGPHRDLVLALGFRKEVIISGGVGLVQSSSLGRDREDDPTRSRSNFVFVGRLSQEKNLAFLVNCFRELKNCRLSLVGKGPLEDYLKGMVAEEGLSNIIFRKYVPNTEIGTEIQKNDYLLLTSESETWGLVVEEALYNQVPVVVSDVVGSARDLVYSTGAGLVFKAGDPWSFLQTVRLAILPVVHQMLVESAGKLDPNARAAKQVAAYSHG